MTFLALRVPHRFEVWADRLHDAPRVVEAAGRFPTAAAPAPTVAAGANAVAITAIAAP